MSQVQATITAPQRPWFFAFGKIDSSLRAHATIWTYPLLTAGLLVRIRHASGTFLNSDEAMQFAIANKGSWWQTYSSNLSINAHPPLLVFMLHLWRHFGTSELMLRTPSILAGVAFCWLTFRWLSLLFEATVPWVAFVLLLFLPSSIQMSTEVRHYAIFLAFAMASAYLLEYALAKLSAPAMLSSGVCLWLAIFTHFSAFLFAALLGVYAIWRMARTRPPLRIWATWELGEVVALGLCYFFYVTQFPVLQRTYKGSSAARGWMANSYLAKYYFRPGEVNPVSFILGRTGSFFQFTFGQLALGDLALLVFILGIVALYLRPSLGRVSSHQLAALLLSAFGINCAAALLHAYPYGGIRHCAFLLPFAIAGVSVALAWFFSGRIAPAIAVAVLAAGFCNLFPSKQLLPDPPGATRLANMKAAISFIRQVSPTEAVLVDPQTSVLLGYYLCERRPLSLNYSVPDFVSYECGGHKIIVAKREYVFTPAGFGQVWGKMIREYKLATDSRIWVVQMGWGTRLADALASVPEMHLAPHDFGSEIQVFDLMVGQRMPDPSLLPAS